MVECLIVFFSLITAVIHCESFTNTIDHIDVHFLDSNDNPAQIVSMTLIRQVSDYRCIEGVTYFFVGSSITVKNGCRAKFTVCFFDTPTPQPHTTTSPLETTTEKIIFREFDQYNKCVLKMIFT